MPSLRKLETTQKENLLNDVYSVGETGPGGAYHEYLIVPHDAKIIESGDTFGLENGSELLYIKHQKGARKDPSSISGVLDCDLLEVVKDRLTKFQEGEFACEENQLALKHVEEALIYMKMRVDNRAKRGVLGSMNK